jgi:hypothetical protein
MASGYNRCGRNAPSQTGFGLRSNTFMPMVLETGEASPVLYDSMAVRQREIGDFNNVHLG